jgi:predicted TIM-barrel fold metal-dependent hydrolase
MTGSEKPKAGKPDSEVLISADSHVAEPEELWDRLPATLRAQRPVLETLPDGGERYTIEGSTISLPLREELSEDDWAREYRRDPSGARDLDRRMADMAHEGVDAQVIFPEAGLGLGGGEGSREYHVAISQAYNDWVLEAFAPEPQRFRPAAMIPTDDAAAAFDEAERCLRKGFKTLFLPVAVPWLPYWHASWEPLWSLAEEANTPLSFHVFSGNVWFGTEFAFLPFLTPERFEATQKLHREVGDTPERYASTVVGMAAGMSPIIDLTGAGVLERHPGLRFAVIESECGWLAWTLAAMDSMQDKRRLYLNKLPLRASEYFLRQGAVAITDDPVGLHNIALTGSDCLLWGNDYPHDEGTFPNRRKVIDSMRESVDAEPLAKILGENAARLYDFDLDYLTDHEISAAS